ncbi:MAG: hypothetical protein ABIS26_02085 [Candidatus Paceibacterota bacterium]
MEEDKHEDQQNGKNTRSIHGYDINYDENSDSQKHLAHEWKHNLSRDDMKRLTHEAKHAPDGKIHLDDGKHTFVHNEDGTFTLRKRNL